MRENPKFALEDEVVVRRLIEENPWATLVSHTSEGLVASHYPVMLDDGREELAVLTHLGRPDEKVHELGDRELLMIVQGPHGYISPSWYGPGVHVPTWNFVVAHLSGIPEILDPDENLAVLERLVDHFERHVASPHQLMGAPEKDEFARRFSRGTVGLRLTPTKLVAKRKMSQNKTPEIVRSVMAELEGDGPYGHAALAREMRLVYGADPGA